MKVDLNEMEWVFNIPFNLVDRGFTAQLRDKEFSYEEYLEWSSWMDESLSIWNLVLLDKDKRIVFFSYGTWNPLEKELEVKRVSMRPEYFPMKWIILLEEVAQLKRLCKKLGVLHIYFITPKWEGYLRRIPSYLKFIDMRMLEVI